MTRFKYGVSRSFFAWLAVFFAFFLCSTSVYGVSSEGEREWTSGTHTVTASFDGLTEDGKNAILRKGDKTLEIPLSQLSEADREWISKHNVPLSNLRDAESDDPFASLKSSDEESSDDWGDSPTRAAGTARTIKVAGIDCVFHWAPPGEFEMGSLSSEEGREDEETPHTVKLPRGFWIGETEVTQGLWKAVMGTRIEYQAKKASYGGAGLYGVGSDYPMYYVSWEDCQEFIEKLNDLGATPSGYEFRLPTEAEWEYACRAGTQTAYWWGNALNGDKANCDGNLPCGTTTKGKWLGKTTPVKSYNANAWGLYDTHGNVCEWCSDWYDEDYYTRSPTEAPTGPTSASDRVIRGGSWSSSAKNCRSASRNYGKPSYRYRGVGLRLVLSSSK